MNLIEHRISQLLLTEGDSDEDLSGLYKEISEIGTVSYYKKGTNMLHREEGPAVEYADGSKKWYWHGKLHRTDGPAVEWVNGRKEYCLNGKLHRASGPAVEWPNGRKEYWINGEQLEDHRDREDLSATNFDESSISDLLANDDHDNRPGTRTLDLPDGTKKYFVDSRLHREDGPALIRPDGTKEWYIHGLLHREDGPAIEYPDGSGSWLINGKHHREDGPAVDNKGGRSYWYLDGKEVPPFLNREDLATTNFDEGVLSEEGSNNELRREVSPGGTVSYYKKGTDIPHREDGPAYEFEDGRKEWWLNGNLHREDGPAVVTQNGTKAWWLRGVQHREDGPAVIRPDGSKEYWINGVRIEAPVEREDLATKNFDESRILQVLLKESPLDKDEEVIENVVISLPARLAIKWRVKDGVYILNLKVLWRSDTSDDFTTPVINTKDLLFSQVYGERDDYGTYDKLVHECMILATRDAPDALIDELRDTLTNSRLLQRIHRDIGSALGVNRGGVLGNFDESVGVITDGNHTAEEITFPVTMRLVTGGNCLGEFATAFVKLTSNASTMDDYVGYNKGDLLMGIAYFSKSFPETYEQFIDKLNMVREDTTASHEALAAVTAHPTVHKLYRTLRGNFYPERENLSVANFDESSAKRDVSLNGTVIYTNTQGQLHRDDGPAVEYKDGSTEWFVNGKKHREGGPATDHIDGTRYWQRHGNYHREDGPAVEYPDGKKEYWLNGVRVEPFANREELPTSNFDESSGDCEIRVSPSGSREYYEPGTQILHREDGPASIQFDGHKEWYQNGKLHRDDGPAIEWPDGSKCWYKHGKLHRTDGPASVSTVTGQEWWFIEGEQVDPFSNREDLPLNNFDESTRKLYSDETVHYFNDQGQLHREDGPAYENKYGLKGWYINGKQHREDGPAHEDVDGSKAWYVNGKCHREDEPAVIRADGTREWWRDGKHHREDGPAVEYSDGSKEYWLNGVEVEPFAHRKELSTSNFDESSSNGVASTETDGNAIKRFDKYGNYHCEDGPATEYSDGSYSWFSHGERHRTDGPAVVWDDGQSKSWYVNGKCHREDGPAQERADGYKAWVRKGRKHREDGPAVIRPDGSKEYWLNGEQLESPTDREDLPLSDFDESVIEQATVDRVVGSDGTIRYFLTGTIALHREDGPALTHPSGNTAWFLNGQCHREDGPAVERFGSNGKLTKIWYKHGKKHREDGPAIEYSDGREAWYLNGEEVEPFTNRKDLPLSDFDESTEEVTRSTNEQDQIVYYKTGTNILHREDGPAVESSKGMKEWWQHGKLHRTDGPAVIWLNGKKEWWINGEQVEPFEPPVNRKDLPLSDFDESKGVVEKEVTAAGDIYYTLNGKLHREDGPAIVLKDGTREWLQNGHNHREDGPAIEDSNGDKLWYLDGKHHREDGPAMEYADGTKEWWINGKQVEPFTYREDLSTTNFDESSLPQKVWDGTCRKIVAANGTSVSYEDEDGNYHREDGPAVEYKDGSYSWFSHGERHRTDGPAVVWDDGQSKSWYINGFLHREDGPAVDNADGTKEWWLNGKQVEPFVNRDELSASNFDESKIVEALEEVDRVVESDGIHYYKKGTNTLHREDGPAVEYADGSKSWCRDGKMHREDGPAYEGEDGTKEWWLNGKRHREDGPAYVAADGYSQWYINDEMIDPPTNREHLHLNDFDESLISDALS